MGKLQISDHVAIQCTALVLCILHAINAGLLTTGNGITTHMVYNVSLNNLQRIKIPNRIDGGEEQIMQFVFVWSEQAIGKGNFPNTLLRHYFITYITR